MNPLLAKMAGPLFEKALGELRGVIDEVAGGEENRELRLKALEALSELEEQRAVRDAAIYQAQASVLIADATGKEKWQRLWRPVSALMLNTVTMLVILANLVAFPIFKVVSPPGVWQVLAIMIPAVCTLMGINVAGRSFEKSRGIDAMAGALERQLPKETKAGNKRIRAMKKAGLSPEQIQSVLESEED